MTEKLNNTLKIFLLIFAILFIGCSNSNGNIIENKEENKEEKEEETEETENTTTKLPELPEAVGGKLTKERYKDLPNKEVTEENLPDFIEAFRAAKSLENLEQNVSVQRGDFGKSELFNGKNEKATRTTSGDTESGSFTIPDGQGGYIIWEWTYKWEMTNSEGIFELTETGTERYQSFDYSKSGKLFFGEVVCMSFHEYWYIDETEEKEIMEGEANGKIEFMGEFAGNIEYKFPYYKETESSVASVAANRSDDLYEGEIIINSGKNKIELSVDDWWDFWYLLESPE